MLYNQLHACLIISKLSKEASILNYDLDYKRICSKLYYRLFIPAVPKNYPFLPIPNIYILFTGITLWLCNVSNIAKPIIHNNDITLFEVVKSTVCLTCGIRGAFGEH